MNPLLKRRNGICESREISIDKSNTLSSHFEMPNSSKNRIKNNKCNILISSGFHSEARLHFYYPDVPITESKLYNPLHRRNDYCEKSPFAQCGSHQMNCSN